MRAGILHPRRCAGLDHRLPAVQSDLCRNLAPGLAGGHAGNPAGGVGNADDVCGGNRNKCGQEHDSTVYGQAFKKWHIKDAGEGSGDVYGECCHQCDGEHRRVYQELYGDGVHYHDSDTGRSANDQDNRHHVHIKVHRSGGAAGRRQEICRGSRHHGGDSGADAEGMRNKCDDVHYKHSPDVSEHIIERVEDVYAC